MTLQRRALLWLLLSAPLVWAIALGISLQRARGEINELFDTELIRLARQVQATLPTASLREIDGAAPAPITRGDSGEADLDTLSIAVWNREGRLLLSDREGVLLPHRPDASGFTDLTLGGAAWRAYYLQAVSGQWIVAAGQSVHERDELMWGLVAGQLVPWVLTLPVLLGVIALAVRQALKPVETLVAELDARPAHDLRPLPSANLPSDLKPLVAAMNTLFARITAALEHERRFTADAAHELRTPLAALQAQWDAAQLEAPAATRDPDDRIGRSLARLRRLVEQLLSLSRIDADLPAGAAALADPTGANGANAVPIDWALLAEQVFGDVLPLAEQRHVELACEWPPEGVTPLPLRGDPALLAALLRNLLDNALRHSPAGAQVTLRLGAATVRVLDEGSGVAPEHLARLGDRFYRAGGGSDESGVGSGLGLSIARLIAQAHGLRVDWANRADRSGFIVTVAPAGSAVSPHVAGSPPLNGPPG